MIGHWRQPFGNRPAPAQFSARETKVSKTLPDFAVAMQVTVSRSGRPSKLIWSPGGGHCNICKFCRFRNESAETAAVSILE
jgi:ADP-ribose pyrophosphatase YjhB (NUDIX family)